MNMPNDGSLRVENLKKTFASANGDGTEAGVHDVSFEVPDAKGFTLLGPSGCGKTTTLRMIGGLETPSSGRIVYDGRDITHLSPQQRDVRTVFQRYALFPHLPVSENIAFGLRMQKRPNAEVKERVGKIAELIEIKHLLPRRTNQLSGGEQQRVALARALITEPGVLLLDEPLSALDLKLRERMQLELLTLRKKLGMTFIFVTHDQTEAMVLSDLIGIMNKGRLEQVGSPEEIYTRPKTRFVAQFIGQANFLGQEQAALLKGETEKLPQLAANREWMLRPESVIPRKRVTRLAAGLVALPGRITELAFLGQDRLAKVLDASGRTHLARFPGHEPLSVAENDEIWLTFKPESVWSVEHSS